MGVGWIDQIYNNSAQTWYIVPVDDINNGLLWYAETNTTMDLQDGGPHPLNPRATYFAQWCGIPWYNGLHCKQLQRNVSPQGGFATFFALADDNANYIHWENGITGVTLVRQPHLGP